MRIVFFGSPFAATPSLEKLIEAGHCIELVITQPDKLSGRGQNLAPCAVKKFAQARNLPVLQPEKIRTDLEALEKIKVLQPDLNVVVAYGQIIPGSIIYLPRYHSLNVHFSLLPKYRGASPVQWAILNGERKTGITIFELNEKMDEGDILSQEEVEIRPIEKAFELEERLAQKGAALLVKTISEIDRIKPTPQNHSLATYAPKLKKEKGRIDWTQAAELIERKVKALARWPSAFTYFRGKLTKIHEGRMVSRTALLPSPGEILSARKEGIEVCCGEKSIYLIERLQLEDKKEIDAHAFSLGARITPGEKFS